MMREHPFGHGRVAYVQIPAIDVNASAAFYQDTFGWQIRGGSASHLSFSDATDNVIGAFVTGRNVSDDPGIILYIYVHGLDATLDQIKAAGRAVVKEPYREGDVWVATVFDPAGNVIGIWQFAPR